MIQLIVFILLAIYYLPLFIASVLINWSWNWGVREVFPQLMYLNIGQSFFCTLFVALVISFFRWLWTGKITDFAITRYIDPLKVLNDHIK